MASGSGTGLSVTNFSVTPKYFIPGDIITVTFSARLTTVAMTGFLKLSLQSGPFDPVSSGSGLSEPVVVKDCYTSERTAFYKGRDVTFSFDMQVPDLEVQHEENRIQTGIFKVEIEKENDSATVFSAYVYPDSSAEWHYVQFLYPPQIISEIWADTTKCRDSDQTLAEYFGGYVKGKSYLVVSYGLNMDTNADPNLKIVKQEFHVSRGNEVIFSVVDTDENRIAQQRIEAGLLPFTGSFDVFNGTLSSEIKVTDNRGQTTTMASFGGTAVYDYAADVSLSALRVERYNPDAVDSEGNHTYPEDASGNMVRFGFESKVSSVAARMVSGYPVDGKNAWTLTLECGPVGGTSPEIVVPYSDTDGKTVNVVIGSDESRAVFTDTVPETERWYFTFTLADKITSTSLTVYVDKAGGIFNVERYGLGFGMRSLATAGDPNKGDVAPGWQFRFHQAEGDPFMFPPAVSNADNGKVLMVVEGRWQLGNKGSSGVSPASAIKSVASAQYQNNAEVESVDLPGATTLGTYAFQNCTNLKTVNLPLVEVFPVYTFAGCAALKTVDLGAAKQIANYVFQNCSSLETLILRGNTVPTITAYVFPGSGIANGTGYVYVYASLVESCKAANIWKNYASQVRAIEDYPEITGG